MTYTSRTNVEDYLRTTFSLTTTPSTTTVDDWVTDVDTEIDDLTGTSWTVSSRTQTFDLNSSTNKFLADSFPLVSVTSIKYNDYTLTDPEFNPNWVDFDNYRTVGDMVITDKWVDGKNKVQLVYTHGHASVPPQVEHLATLMVVKKIISSEAMADNRTESLSIGSISLKNTVGMSTLLNIDSLIEEQLKRVGKYKTVFRNG